MLRRKFLWWKMCTHSEHETFRIDSNDKPYKIDTSDAQYVKVSILQPSPTGFIFILRSRRWCSKNPPINSKTPIWIESNYWSSKDRSKRGHDVTNTNNFIIKVHFHILKNNIIRVDKKIKTGFNQFFNHKKAWQFIYHATKKLSPPQIKKRIDPSHNPNLSTHVT